MLNITMNFWQLVNLNTKLLQNTKEKKKYKLKTKKKKMKFYLKYNKYSQILHYKYGKSVYL